MGFMQKSVFSGSNKSEVLHKALELKGKAIKEAIPNLDPYVVNIMKWRVTREFIDVSTFEGYQSPNKFASYVPFEKIMFRLPILEVADPTQIDKKYKKFMEYLDSLDATESEIVKRLMVGQFDVKGWTAALAPKEEKSPKKEIKSPKVPEIINEINDLGVESKTKD